MKRSFFCILLLLTVTASAYNIYAQNDTIYLKKDHIIFRDTALNLTNPDNEKTGYWIEFEIKIIHEDCLASGVNIETGEDMHFHDYKGYEYRPLEEGEQEEMVIAEHESTLHYSSGTIYTINQTILRSKVPSYFYYILAKGKYDNGKRNGFWTYYHESGAVKKEIEYSNGIPLKSFVVFYEDGSPMIKLEKQKGGKIWTMYEYSDERKCVGMKEGSIGTFSDLY